MVNKAKREQEEYIRAANEALASLSEKGARLWLYAVSHQTLELVVGDPGGRDNIILFLSVEWISGPVAWDRQQLKVVWTVREGEWHFTVQDEPARFRVEALTFGWKRNFDILTPGSFNFPDFPGVRRDEGETE